MPLIETPPIEEDSVTFDLASVPDLERPTPLDANPSPEVSKFMAAPAAVSPAGPESSPAPLRGGVVAPSTVRARPMGTDRVRSTLVSPSEVIAFIHESSRPPPPPRSNDVAEATVHTLPTVRPTGMEEETTARPPAPNESPLTTNDGPDTEIMDFVAPTSRITISDPLDVVFGLVHELAFLSDSQDACAFAARTIRTFLPSRALFIHLFDQRAQGEFVIASARGSAAQEELLGHRIVDSDMILGRLIANPVSKVLSETPGLPSVLSQRHHAGGGATKILVHPIHLAGQLLGAFEVVDPEVELDERFDTALDYLCNRVAEFLSDHPKIFPLPAPVESGSVCYHCLDGIDHECHAKKTG